MPSDALSVVNAYANELRKAYQQHIGVDAWPEEQLKAPVSDLIEQAAAVLGLDVRTFREVRAESIGRPDIGATVDGLLSGHVELKRPGSGANPKKYRGRDRAQWQKLKNLPNLIYTDGTAFAHFRSGERVGKIVRLSGDPTADGADAVSEKDAKHVLHLFRTFFDWQPVVPKHPKALAKLLAPVCLLLREDVEEALEDGDSPLSRLAADWRQYFFPAATDREFADAYAQTLTYAFLLARFSGTDDLSVEHAASAIESGHQLLAETLRVLGTPSARAQVQTPLHVLERILDAVEPDIFAEEEDGEEEIDPWLYFYEDFLAEYDPRMRKDRGVYFTPWQVVQAQVHLVAQLLDERFDAPDAFANQDVVTLDPACGTGTYILAAVRHGLDAVAERRGEGARASAATRAAAGAHAFEFLVGPYAVAHLRLTQQITANGGRLPADGAHVYLTDTLDSPNQNDPDRYLPLLYEPLGDEQARAQHVKREAPVLVCIGNPPYDRQQAEQGETIAQRKGGWVRFGDPEQKGQEQRPILRDFLDPLAATGDGVHAKNLYNDYVYFWRWALWKVCEQGRDQGVVSFITASSYLRGPGFKGMRKMMREAFDDLWILDLGGDNLGARTSDNVFAIRTPVCIATGVRHPEGHVRRQPEGTPARVRFARIEGSEEEKLDALRALRRFDHVAWQDCPARWTAPFLPAQAEAFNTWPLVTDLFPWRESGMQLKRKWPISSDQDTLRRRWHVLLNSNDRATALKESRDLKVDKTYARVDDPEQRDPSIASLPNDAEMPEPSRIGYRSFDRQWALVDNRLGDYFRPRLQKAHSGRQVYITSLLTVVLGEGPAATATAHLPDLHHFSRRGGKDVIPLWRDRAGREANLTRGVTHVLAEAYGRPVAPEHVFAYAYAVLSAPAYVDEFWEALETPGPRLPITKGAALFAEAAALGREFLWLHTYGARFVPDGARRGPHGLPQGTARLARATPTDPERYPDTWSYDEATCELRIGEEEDEDGKEKTGLVTGVPPGVMAFTVSGFQPVKSWLDYRMKSGAGRKSSPLDDLRPRTWSFDEALLDLLLGARGHARPPRPRGRSARPHRGGRDVPSRRLPRSHEGRAQGAGRHAARSAADAALRRCELLSRA